MYRTILFSLLVSFSASAQPSFHNGWVPLRIQGLLAGVESQDPADFRVLSMKRASGFNYMVYDYGTALENGIAQLDFRGNVVWSLNELGRIMQFEISPSAIHIVRSKQNDVYYTAIRLDGQIARDDLILSDPFATFAQIRLDVNEAQLKIGTPGLLYTWENHVLTSIQLPDDVFVLHTYTIGSAEIIVAWTSNSIETLVSFHYDGTDYLNPMDSHLANRARDIDVLVDSAGNINIAYIEDDEYVFFRRGVVRIPAGLAQFENITADIDPFGSECWVSSPINCKRIALTEDENGVAAVFPHGCPNPNGRSHYRAKLASNEPKELMRSNDPWPNPYPFNCVAVAHGDPLAPLYYWATGMGFSFTAHR